MVDVGVKYTRDAASAETISQYFIGVADLFIPNLFLQVKDMSEYVNKIKQNGVVFEAWDNDSLIGVVAAYFNDFKSRRGFVTSVSVAKNLQNKGIAKNLLLAAIQYGKEKNFERIRLEVSTLNDKAVLFYKRMGFVVIDEVVRNKVFVMELYL